MVEWSSDIPYPTPGLGSLLPESRMATRGRKDTRLTILCKEPYWSASGLEGDQRIVAFHTEVPFHLEFFW